MRFRRLRRFKFECFTVQSSQITLLTLCCFQVNKGPVDYVSHEARYSLSEEKLIRQQTEYRAITVFVSMSPQTIYMSGLDPHGDNMDIPVRVLDCDTVTQVKDKALDTIYRAISYSSRPKHSDLDLEWRTGTSGRLILYDEDSTTKTEGDWKRINTLNHYRVPDGALLTLIPKQSSMYNISTMSDKSDRHLYHKYETLNISKMSGGVGGGGGHSPPLSRATSPLNHDYDSGIKNWHLVRHDSDSQKDERTNKLVSEIYLTRLLATKGTLQKFVDDLFETIFSTAHRGSALPLAIKVETRQRGALEEILNVDIFSICLTSWTTRPCSMASLTRKLFIPGNPTLFH